MVPNGVTQRTAIARPLEPVGANNFVYQITYFSSFQ
jgi:hypothetical protein